MDRDSAKQWWDREHVWHEDVDPDEVGRLYEGPEVDSNRDCFQRDIDRIVWSSAFKRLANKTQVFSLYLGDNQRQRLTHSLEVAQLAVDLTRRWHRVHQTADPALPQQSEFACRAMALAHDIGHTPFGHEGERTLDSALSNHICIYAPRQTPSAGVDTPPCDPGRKDRADSFLMPNTGCLTHDSSAVLRGLSRFSHYEQGLDVVSYLEAPPGGTRVGMGLTPTVMGGIFKHNYEEKMDPLRTVSKYQSISPNTSIEARIVRICDKISYCVSDVEDSLSMETMNVDDVMSVFRDSGVTIGEGSLSSIMDESCRSVAIRRLRNVLLKWVLKSVAASFSSEGQDWVNDTTDGDCFKTLHKKAEAASIRHFTVQRADRRGGHIVRCLLCQYLHHPEMISASFRRRMQQTQVRERIKKLYRIDRMPELASGKEQVDIVLRWHSPPAHCGHAGGCGIESCDHVSRRYRVKARSIFDVICAKDYIAGMTDYYAEERYRRDVDCCISKKKWRAEGFDDPPAWPQY